MLKLFSSRGEHPLAEDRELQRALSDIGAMSAEDALGEVFGWLASLAPGPELDTALCLRLLSALDEAMQPHSRHLEAQFITAAMGRHERASSVRRLARQCWAGLIDRYGELLTAAETERAYTLIAEICVRLLRASSAVQRWDALRYGRFDADLWRRAGHALQAAKSLGVALRPVKLRAARANETTVEQEYLRAVALATAATSELDEMQIGLAGRLIHYVLPSLRLSTTSGQDTLFWIDPALGQAPTRMVRQPVQSPTLLFFGSGKALDTLIEMESLAQSGVVPPAMGLDAAETLSAFGSLLKHLIRHWSSEPPVRRHRRHPLPGPLQAVEGLDRALDCLSGTPGAVHTVWDQRDASLQGIGASVSLKEKAARVRIRSLVAVRAPDGDRWLVGIVRRLHRVSEDRLDVGIELQSWHPMPARADDGANELRVLLLDPLQRGSMIRVAVPLEGLRAGAPLYLIGQSKALKLLPGASLERGIDHEIRTYQVAPAG